MARKKLPGKIVKNEPEMVQKLPRKIVKNEPEMVHGYNMGYYSYKRHLMVPVKEKDNG